MNILTVIITILMMMAIMTYARLETFRDFFGVKVEYQKFMQHEERDVFNAKQAEIYEKGDKDERREQQPANPSDAVVILVEDNQSQEEEVDRPIQTAEEDDNSNKPGNLNSLFIMSSFVDKKSRDKDPRFSQYFNIMLRLMDILYREQSSFKELYEQHPDLNTRILQQVMVVAEQPEFKGIKDRTQLANLPLGDPSLQEAFYKMLKGNMQGVDVTKSGKRKGYPPLTDYISLKGEKFKPISIYLAEKPLLIALYGNQSIVDGIIDSRKNLYRAVRKGRMNVQDAQNEFQRQFADKQLSDIDSALLDFKVSKSKPP